MIPFVKMQGTGNDFVVIADLDDKMDISPDFVRAACDRRFGVGADGLIRIRRSAPEQGEKAPFFMDYRNADGTIAEMCGNGVRVVGKWLGDRGLATETIDVGTVGGVKSVALKRSDGLVQAVQVDMGVPVIESITESIVAGEQEFVVSVLSMGNPHAIIFVDDVDRAPVELVGPIIENHQRFPNHTNVAFVAQRGDQLVQRTWERGCGETLSCGTAASAAAVAAQLRGFAGEQVTIELKGGSLQFEWRPTESVQMTGPAVEVFTGELSWTL